MKGKKMKTGDYEWCATCDGEGRVACPACHGLGSVEVNKEKLAELQATVDETSKRIAGDTKEKSMHMGTCKICGANFWESYEGARGSDLCDAHWTEENENR